MRLKLASRKSDLARWQAIQVAKAIEALPQNPSIEFLFKSSLGDQNLDLPLASMGSKGVFTEDFYEDLNEGRCDLVVHSWKDLPTEEREGSHIALTLARADMRDVLMVPERVWAQAAETGELTILTSSPRRIYNLSAALPRLLPAGIHLQFRTVRGNVPTRLQKMHDEGAALILAKAGLDRLLDAEVGGGLTPGVSLREKVADCRFQILPISINPPAPAQGALAIEIARSNLGLMNLLKPLNAPGDYRAVQTEREILKRHGGGCHQKIGVAIVDRAYGQIRSVRGQTDRGETLNEWGITNSTPWARAFNHDAIFPRAAKENSWFARERLAAPGLEHKQALFIARADALPSDFVPSPRQKVWTSGVASWEALAKRGVWVHGCHDGLGESETPGLDKLCGPLVWTKLTHDRAGGEGELGSQRVATYRLSPKAEVPDLSHTTHFFWMSRTSFERALEVYPQVIERGYNACGPGVTYDFLKRQTRLLHPAKVFIGLEQFLAESSPGV